MELSPLAVYEKAVKAVPSLKYALGVAGVVAAATIALNLSNQDPRRAVLGFIFVLAGMYLLLIFASAGKDGDILRGPVILVVWALTILFVLALVLTLSAFATGIPSTLAKLVGAIPADNRDTSAQATVTSPTPAASRATQPASPSVQASVATSVPAIAPPVPAAVAPVRVQETFRVNDSSNDCGANQTRTLEYCLAAGARVLDWSGPSIESANCGSSIANVRRLPGRDGCIALDVSVRGCGYDNILGIQNCKGRGWIGGSVVINGERSGG